MKSLTIAAIILGLVFGVCGQAIPPDFTSMPSCAYTPLQSAVSASGCVPDTDVACFCGTSAFVSTVTSGVSAGCTSDDTATAYRIITELCSLNGVTINLGSSSSPTSTSEQPPSSQSAVQTTPTSAVVSGSTSAPASSVSASTSAPGTTTSPSVSASPSTTGAASPSSVSGSTSAAASSGFVSKSVPGATSSGSVSAISSPTLPATKSTGGVVATSTIVTNTLAVSASRTSVLAQFTGGAASSMQVDLVIGSLVAALGLVLAI